jgi:hypothetical protein
MNVQQGSWNKLKQQLPCSSCLAGKMRKLNKAGSIDYTDLDNLALSWTPNTAEKKVKPNGEVSIDWGIINCQILYILLPVSYYNIVHYYYIIVLHYYSID